MTPGPLAVTLEVAAVLDRLGIDYVLGGSMASSIVGEPRSTVDIDLAVELDRAQLDGLTDALRPTFYVPDAAAREAVATQGSFNVLHQEVALKVDLFVLGDSLLDRRQLERRARMVVSADGTAELWVTSAEDQVLRKLDWYRAGGSISDRQWRDVVSVLATQRGRLDDSYLDETARVVSLTDLLSEARKDAEAY